MARPELVIPHVTCPSIKWLDWQALKQAGFEAVVMDKDNTLTLPYAAAPHEPLLAALEECKACFPGRVAVMSNSAGLQQYDPAGATAAALARSLGVPVIRHPKKKPAGTAAPLELQLNCPAQHIVFIGDRALTDVAFGNRNQLLTILVAPIAPHKDPFSVQQVRPLEDALVEFWRSRGIQAPRHPVFSGSPFSLLKDPACW